MTTKKGGVKGVVINTPRIMSERTVDCGVVENLTVDMEERGSMEDPLPHSFSFGKE